MVGVPISAVEHVVEHADVLVRYLTGMPDKQASALVAIESLGQRAGYQTAS